MSTTQDDVDRVVEAFGADQFSAGQAAATAELQPQIDTLTDTNARLEAQVTDLAHQLDLALHPTKVLIALDLSVVPLGKLTAVSAGKMFGQPGKIGADSSWKNYSVVADPDGRRWLRWSSAKGTAGSKYGISVGIPFWGGARVTECTHEVTIRFSPNFDTSAGGKLGGVSATRPGADPEMASGGKDPKNEGSSSRIMWYTKKAGWSKILGAVKNSLANYWYANGKTEQVIFWLKPFENNVPINIKIRQAMNDVGKANGILQSWQDGQMVADKGDMPWRGVADNLWSHQFFSEFRGGPNDVDLWEGATDGWIDFADGMRVTAPAAA